MLTLILAATFAAQATPQEVPPATTPAPEVDSRGIPVESAPAVAPAGTNLPVAPDPAATVVVNPNQQAAFTPSVSIAEVPACSKTVTDHCKQTYEKQGR